MSKYPILERPQGKQTVRVIGNVYADLAAEDVAHEFMAWLDSKGWTFFGHMVDLAEEDDDDAIFEVLLGDEGQKGIAIVPQDKNRHN
ncbi:MAG: hypothetical protein IRZ10_08545 [Thermoflavifilum sp.]|nr:hypothetical protein [Thermoflavifilum sp.]MCL6514460.1 hypothetical protein [Alicyclobacillus sp.]